MNLFEALKNIWKFNIKPILNLEYPIYILPKPKYKLRMEMDAVLSNPNFFIIRKSSLPLNQSFNTASKLKDKAIAIERIPFMSSNILGGKFKSKNIDYSTKGKAAAIWDGNIIRLKDYKNLYAKEKGVPIYIPTHLIHNIPVPFEAVNSTVNRQRVNGLPFEPTAGNKMKLSGNTKVIHSPTNLNYWHVELEVNDFNQKPIKNSKGEFNDHACDFILDIISENAEMVEPKSYFKIDKNFYLAS